MRQARVTTRLLELLKSGEMSTSELARAGDTTLHSVRSLLLPLVGIRVARRASNTRGEKSGAPVSLWRLEDGDEKPIQRTVSTWRKPVGARITSVFDLGRQP